MNQFATHTSNLADLLARVEAVEGPNRELDLTLGLALAGWEVGPDADFGGEYLHTENILYAWPTSPGAGYESFTESVDLALALCERVLPGWVIGLDQQASDFWEAVLSKASGRFMIEADGECYGTAKTPALALLAAMLKAKIAELQP